MLVVFVDVLCVPALVVGVVRVRVPNVVLALRVNIRVVVLVFSCRLLVL